MVDDYKKAILDLLSKESVQVLQVAYVYAKNFVRYGEDITKEWNTAVQQASILQKARQDGWVEAYDSFKDEMIAMLTELDNKITEEYIEHMEVDWHRIIQLKINALKSDGSEEQIGENT